MQAYVVAKVKDAKETALLFRISIYFLYGLWPIVQKSTAVPAFRYKLRFASLFIAIRQPILPKQIYSVLKKTFQQLNCNFIIKFRVKILSLEKHENKINNSINCLIFIFCNSLLSQTKSDTIVIKKHLGGYRYEMNGRNLRPVEVMEQIHDNKQAFHLMQKARTGNGFASALSYVGGFLIGWPIGAAAGGGDAQWGMAAIGAGLVLVAIPISIQSNKNARKAVQTYNQSKKSLSFKIPVETELTINGNGISLILKL